MIRDEKPTIDDIMKAKVYDYSWYMGVHYKKYIKNIEIIGQAETIFNYVSKGIGSSYSGWITFVSELNDKHYKFIENSDIKDIETYLKMPPNKIAERQKKNVLRHLHK